MTFMKTVLLDPGIPMTAPGPHLSSPGSPRDRHQSSRAGTPPECTSGWNSRIGRYKEMCGDLRVPLSPRGRGVCVWEQNMVGAVSC